MKECLKRALRTFVQAAFGYLAANLVAAVHNLSVADRIEAADIITMLVASTVAAGLAAVMNMGKKPLPMPSDGGDGDGEKVVEIPVLSEEEAEAAEHDAVSSEQGKAAADEHGAEPSSHSSDEEQIREE